MDEDFFSDDGGLDDLPSNTLQEIESRAFTSTQRRASDYGLEDDEEVINLDAPPLDEVTQREQWRQQRYGAAAQQRLPAFRPPRPSQQAPTRISRPTSAHAAEPDPAARTPPLQSQLDIRAGAQPSADLSTLQARIAQLEQSQSRLLRENQDAKAQSYAKAGEISIVRANQEKAAKDYEQKLAALQGQHAQELAKHKAEMDAIRKERERMETSNKFLEHDLAQEVDRTRNARRLQRTGNDKPRPQPSPASTPKKKSSLPYRDGFNEEEVISISPSKSKAKSNDRSRGGTPKAANKRKRQGDVSPAKQLPFGEQEDPVVIENGTPSAATSFENLEQALRDTGSDKRYDLVQLVLNHRQDDDQRTVELLLQYSLPSAPSSTLSSYIYDALTKPPQTRRPSSEDREIRSFEADLCHAVMDLWHRCVVEQMFPPVKPLMSLVQRLLLGSSEEISSVVVTKAVSAAIQTADIVATPRARAWANPSANPSPSTEVVKYIRSLDYIQFLQTLATMCVDDQETTQSFWTSIEHDLILVMLHKAQPLQDRLAMLSILGTSVSDESFGAIHKSVATGNEYEVKQKQQQSEYNLISRLANLLIDRSDQVQHVATDLASLNVNDTSQSPTSDQPTVIDLRLATLDLLTNLCSTQHGGRLLASHRFATGRIIRLLHESILSMYNYNPKIHELVTACVNQAVTLLAHLCFVHGDSLDLRARLAAEPSGYHKHLVALSRVAFSNGESMIEEGIWSESAEAAHRMLDEFLSPEEGDAVVNVFSSIRTTG